MTVHQMNDFGAQQWLAALRSAARSTDVSPYGLSTSSLVLKTHVFATAQSERINATVDTVDLPPNAVLPLLQSFAIKLLQLAKFSARLDQPQPLLSLPQSAQDAIVDRYWTEFVQLWRELGSPTRPSKIEKVPIMYLAAADVPAIQGELPEISPAEMINCAFNNPKDPLAAAQRALAAVKHGANRNTAFRTPKQALFIQLCSALEHLHIEDQRIYRGYFIPLARSLSKQRQLEPVDVAKTILMIRSKFISSIHDEKIAQSTLNEVLAWQLKIVDIVVDPGLRTAVTAQLVIDDEYSSRYSPRPSPKSSSTTPRLAPGFGVMPVAG